MEMQKKLIDVEAREWQKLRLYAYTHGLKVGNCATMLLSRAIKGLDIGEERKC